MAEATAASTPEQGSGTAVAEEPNDLADPAGAEALDHVLAATATELAAADEEFLDFADPAAVLGEATSPPTSAEQAPAGAPPPAEATAAEVSSPQPEGVDNDLSDFADPSALLGEISAELEAAADAETPLNTDADVDEPDSAPPVAPDGDAPTTAEPGGVPQTAERPSTPDAPPEAGPAGAIERLDEVLAAEAETVLEKTPETPRIADPAGPAAVAATASPAPSPPATPAPAATAPKPPPPATEVTAASDAEAPAPKPRPAPRIRPLLAAGVSRALRPLIRANSRLSHTARQTIAWAALITVFNAAWLWGYVLVRDPRAAPEPSGEGTRFYQPGDPAPEHQDDHGGAHPVSQHSTTPAPAAAGKHDAGHGEKGAHAGTSHGKAAASTKKKDAGHSASAKKKDSKPKSSKKKDEQKQAAHH